MSRGGRWDLPPERVELWRSPIAGEPAAPIVELRVRRVGGCGCGIPHYTQSAEIRAMHESVTCLMPDAWDCSESETLSTLWSFPTPIVPRFNDLATYVGGL